MDWWFQGKERSGEGKGGRASKSFIKSRLLLRYRDLFFSGRGPACGGRIQTSLSLSPPVPPSLLSTESSVHPSKLKHWFWAHAGNVLSRTSSEMSARRRCHGTLSLRRKTQVLEKAYSAADLVRVVSERFGGLANSRGVIIFSPSLTLRHCQVLPATHPWSHPQSAFCILAVYFFAWSAKSGPWGKWRIWKLETPYLRRIIWRRARVQRHKGLRTRGLW